MAGRKGNGEGSIDRHHSAAQGCPPVGAGKVRPKHRCQAPYRARATVTVDGRKVRRTVYGPTKDDVVGKLRNLFVEDRQGTLVALDTSTVAGWLTEWLAEAGQDLKANTRVAYHSRITTYLVPHLGHHRLTALAPEHVDRMYRAMRKAGKAEGTLRQTHMVLRGALDEAMLQRKVSRNVARMVKSPKPTQARRAVMTLDEAHAVLAAAGDNPRAYVALLCGLRQGEALALRWCDVYLDGVPVPYLVVRHSMTREPGQGLVATTPKSDASRGRIVPLLPEVAARLRVQRAKHLAKGWTDEAGLVFPTRNGTPQYSNSDRGAWLRLLAKAGVGPYALHSARATCAHLLEDAGVLPRVVADILGHSDVKITYRYQDGNEPAKVAAMGALAALVAKPDDDGASGALVGVA